MCHGDLYIQPRIPYKHTYQRSFIFPCDMITKTFISASGRCTIGNENSCVVYLNGVLGHVNSNVHRILISHYLIRYAGPQWLLCPLRSPDLNVTFRGQQFFFQKSQNLGYPKLLLKWLLKNYDTFLDFFKVPEILVVKTSVAH